MVKDIGTRKGAPSLKRLRRGVMHDKYGNVRKNVRMGGVNTKFEGVKTYILLDGDSQEEKSRGWGQYRKVGVEELRGP